MRQLRRRATWTGAVLGALTAFLAMAFEAHASDWQGSETEEFHQTYPLSSTGRIELQNINGSVQITAWDKNEIKAKAEQIAAVKLKSQNMGGNFGYALIFLQIAIMLSSLASLTKRHYLWYIGLLCNIGWLFFFLDAWMLFY